MNKNSLFIVKDYVFPSILLLAIVLVPFLYNEIMNLFAIYIGGRTSTSLIEVHDMRFTVGHKIEDTYDQLRNEWWGTPSSLHLDAWGILSYCDGYEIQLKNEPPNADPKLYFLNLGGYDSNEFTELHKNVFVVANNEQEAKLKGKASINHWITPHKDAITEIESCINISDQLSNSNLYVHLIPSSFGTPFEFCCKYVPIG